MVSSLSLFSFLRRFAIACLVVAVLAAVGVFAGEAFARKSFEDSRKIHVPNLVRARPGEPANYLLIGSDTRQLGDLDPSFGSVADAPGKNSDVMMVLHVDPASRTGRLVSFPRDLLVQIPGHGRGLLNSAYGLGGPALVIQTLEWNFLPLKINHYIEVNFDGFRDIVNAIGKIKLYFPTPVHDPFSNLHVDKAGCVSADGAMALAYARSRHYFIPKDEQNPAPWQWNYAPGIPDDQRGGQGWVEDPRADLDRIPRQQYFLRTISQAAIDKTAANPTKLIGLLNAVKDSFTRDTTLTFGEMKALIRTFNGLDPRKVQMETLPVVGAPPPNQAHVVATDEALVVATSLMQFDPSPPVPKPLPPNHVRVHVVNGSGIPNAAEFVRNRLAAAGFQITGPAVDADRSNYKETQVRYAPGKYAQGYTTLLEVGTLKIAEAISAENTLGADVLVVVGRDYAQLRPVNETTTTRPQSASPTTETSTTTSTSTTTTTLAKPTADTRYVPVDPKTNGPLVGCPH